MRALWISLPQNLVFEGRIDLFELECAGIGAVEVDPSDSEGRSRRRTKCLRGDTKHRLFSHFTPLLALSLPKLTSELGLDPRLQGFDYTLLRQATARALLRCVRLIRRRQARCRIY